jgi:transketolase
MAKSSLSKKEIEKLRQLTKTFRQQILEMIYHAKSGHPGTSLSVIDMISTLFLHRMKYSKRTYKNFTDDVLILSKGHGVPALYAVLKHVGLLPKKTDLNTLRSLGSILQGHPDRVMLPEVLASTGSLGQGLSMGIGIALAKRVNKDPHRVFVIMGDGELQEGQVWEAVMSASMFGLTNLTVIVDRNRGQIDGHTDEVMEVEPVNLKFEAFGWDTEVIDGHHFQQLFRTCHAEPQHRPLCIIANTVKGKGVSFMENNIKWHGVAPNDEEYELAIKEIQLSSVKA